MERIMKINTDSSEAIIILKQKGIRAKITDGKITFRASNVSPIHTMHERAILTTAQFSAGNAMRAHWVNGMIGYGSCEIKERVDGGAKEREYTTKQVHARRQFYCGKLAVRRDWDLINQVIINEIPLTRKGMSGQKRARLIYKFRLALNDIARCYGFM